MAKSIHRVSVVVGDIEQLGPDVRVLTLQDEEQWELPPFTAGAHVDVHLPSGLIRQYSLCGSVATQNQYQIAVARELSGRGGSREMHDEIQVGQQLLLSLPRNTFPVVVNVPVVMVAGGIGVTPFLSAIEVLNAAGQPYEVHYCVGSEADAVFLPKLKALTSEQSLHCHFSDNHTRLALDSLIEHLDPQAHLYCCGPTRMIDECESFADKLGERLHVEHFAVNASADPAYEIQLSHSGRVVPVVPGQSMLQALRQAGVDIPSSCEAGICLECKCQWLAGSPIHRELTLPKAERDRWITPCVSGSAGPVITLDL